MKLIKNSLFVFMIINLFGINCLAKGENTITGTYKNNEITYEFKEGKCYGYYNGELISECHVKVKGNLVYISPNIPDMEKMIRNVWVVWELKRNALITKYLVDMDDGTKFYEEKAGEIVLNRVE